jgi:putative cell wall-binding protein
MLGELIAANPEFMQWFGDKFLKASNIPDHKELAERAKVMLAPPILAMMAEKDKGEPIPPHAQAQLAKAQEVIQQLTQANEELLKERETDGIKAQADMAKTQAQDQAKAMIEQVKALNAQQLQQMKDDLEVFKLQFTAEQDAKTREDEQRHELAMAAAEAAQKEQDAEAQRRHDAMMGRQAHEAGELAGDSAHERAETSAERAAEREAMAQGDGAGE